MLACLIAVVWCSESFHIRTLTGVDVLSGSFNGTTPEDCEGGILPTIIRSSLV